MIVVTGGTGFIGSAVANALNRRGHDDLLLVDIDDHPEKKKNLASLTCSEFMDRDQFLDALLSGDVSSVSAIFHLGACSSTTETDVAYLTRNNVEYTQHLAKFCLDNNARFIYASSAATYGDGEHGYSDDESELEILKPLNPYGESKQAFDLWAKQEGLLSKIVGLKYFNVFGPNEYHKEDMRSMVLKGFYQARDTGLLRLFKSYRPEYPDGGQVRDFLYIKDAVDMTLFFLDQPEANGIFNVGTGKARCWNDLANAIFDALDKPANIEYIEMPESIRNQYQYHTEASKEKIRKAGYSGSGTSLEDGIRDYVRNYLLAGELRL